MLNIKRSQIYIALSIFALVITSFSVHTTFANTEAENIQKLIDEKQKNLEQLNKEIKLYEELTDKTSQEAKNLQGLINQLNGNIKSIDLDIKRTNGKIDLTNLDIKKLDGNITDTESRIGRLQDGISSSIRAIQLAEDRSLIEHMLTQSDLTGFLAEVEYQLGFNDALQAQVTTMRKQKEMLEVSKHSKEEKKTELVKLQNELSGKKQAVVYTKAERDRALKDTKNQEKNYQKILKDKLALKAATEKEVFEYESKLKYTLDPSSIPQAGSSALSWPLDKVRITQRFGKTVAARRLYVSGSHNGVDFGTPIGTPVKSAASGTVIGAGDTDLTCRGASFGRWILVRHNNGLASIYAHLSVISVREGQIVGAGEVIGYSGNTGYSTGPHLHLTVYAANAVKVENRPSASCGGKVYRMPIAPIDAYLDPMLYLPATS